MRGTLLDKKNTRMNLVYFVFLLLISPAFFPVSSIYGRSTDEIIVDPNNKTVAGMNLPDISISTLTLLVAILTASVTIAIFIPTIVAMVQLRRIDTEIKEFRAIRNEMKEETEKQLNVLKVNVKDYRSPNVILKEAREKAEEICDSGDNALRSHIVGLEEDIKQRLQKLEGSIKERESSYCEIESMLNRIDSEIKSKPSINDIIVEVANKYKIPGDLMEIILGRVVTAFSCLQKLSEEERKEIRKVLSTNPLPMNDDKK